jgi:hypothetical protein
MSLTKIYLRGGALIDVGGVKMISQNLTLWPIRPEPRRGVLFSPWTGPTLRDFTIAQIQSSHAHLARNNRNGSPLTLKIHSLLPWLYSKWPTRDNARILM